MAGACGGGLWLALFSVLLHPAHLTSDGGVECSSSRMVCPVPHHIPRVSTYYMDGSDGDPNCGIQGGGPWFFDFAIKDCNVTRNVDRAAGLVTDTVTLVYREFKNVLVTDLLTNPPRQVFCTCRSPLWATASADFAAESLGIQVDNLGGASANAGDTRLVLEVGPDRSEDDIDHVIGLETCTVAPSAKADDAHAVEFLGQQSGCGAAGGGPLAVQQEPEAERSKVRVSVDNFKFAGTSNIYMWCHVLRCQVAPCGVCESDLGSRRRLQEEETSGQRQILAFGSFTAQESATDVIVLPSTLALPEQAAASWVSSVHITFPRYVATNLTLYGVLRLTQHELDEVASGVSTTVGHLLASDVHVTRIFAVPLLAQDSAQGANKSLHAEAVVVDCRVLWVERELAKLQSLLHSQSFRIYLAQQLTADVGAWPVSLQAEFGPLVLQENTHVANGNGDLALTTLGVALASLVLGCICSAAMSLIFIVIRRKWNFPGKAEKVKKQMQMQTQTQPPVPAVATYDDVDQDFDGGSGYLEAGIQTQSQELTAASSDADVVVVVTTREGIAGPANDHESATCQCAEEIEVGSEMEVDIHKEVSVEVRGTLVAL